MILKRPFAFLIRHFKLIHLILCIPTFYLLYRSSLILDFITEYLNTNTSVVGNDLVGYLFDVKILISLIILFVVIIIVMGLMTYKKKPVTFYVYNLFAYICVSALYMFAYSIIETMEIGLVDIRTIKIVQDLTVTAIIFQVFSSLMFTIRATGFDIKKFDFKHDLAELEISTEDNEEIEIESQFDSDEFKRKTKKLRRHAKYVYAENKTVINLIIIILIGVVCYFIYNNSGIYNKNYELSVAINTENFIFNIKDNYQTSSDYRKNKITDKSLVVINFDVKSNGLASKLDLTRFTLEVGNKSYKNITTYANELKDLGNIYKDDEIGTEFSNYILIFEIPENSSKDKMLLKYKDYNNKYVQITLNPKNIDNNDDVETYDNGDLVKLDDSILEKSEITINGLELRRSFKLEYNFCLNDNECYKSYEYLKPTYTDNYSKSLFKIKGTLTLDENLKNNNINSFENFIVTFGQIKYVINGTEKYLNINRLVSPKNIVDENEYYIEVNSEVERASIITLDLNIRNKKYSYVIK